MDFPLEFRARIVSGRARGRTIGAPTLNLNLDDVPEELQEGLYAAAVMVQDVFLAATLHFGPRPTFNDTKSCEVHVIDKVIEHPPEHLDVRVLKRLRDIQNFGTKEKLMEQIKKDIKDTMDLFLSFHE